nr:MAG TPA: hypothetical protein [Caudoviricetes sp.]
MVCARSFRIVTALPFRAGLLFWGCCGRNHDLQSGALVSGRCGDGVFD